MPWVIYLVIMYVYNKYIYFKNVTCVCTNMFVKNHLLSDNSMVS